MKTTKKYGKKIDLALSLWVKLNRANAVLQKLAAEDIRNTGLTVPQFSVIECLGHLGKLTTGELTKKQLVSGGNVTLVLDNLEKEGFVRRERDIKNRRVVNILLTEKGKKKFNETFIPHANYITKLISILSENEQKTLSKLLKKLGTTLQQINNKS